MKYIAIILLVIITTSFHAANSADAIIGKWIAVPEENLIVEVYKENNEYKGKILWFNDSDDKTKPMKSRLDEKNSNPRLRSRKLIGLEVLNNLVYNEKNNRWESGKIYDAKSGKTWSSSAWLQKDGILKVRGFWHFEFIGQNMDFKRVQ